MIDLYDWPTSNGHKVAIFLEETGLEYRIAPINIRKGEQFAHGPRPDVRPARPLLASGS